MNAWPFVIAAYGVVLLSSGIVSIWAWRAMKAAEARADEIVGR